MAIFTPYYGNIIPAQYTEPCMNCFASVTYHSSEAESDKERGFGHYIVCPNCGKKMQVNFCNTQLC